MNTRAALFCARRSAEFSSCSTHCITEQRDTLGRSTGYIYAKNDIPQQQTSISYGTDGRVATAGFTHQGEYKEFTYSYLPGTHLLHTLTHPNGLTLTQSYEQLRDLPTQMDYTRADALIVRRGYDYDILGRPTARDLARYGTETQDTFGYNTRSELTTAHVNSADYTYAYDAIGNRTAAVENGTRTAYTANRLNQYTAEGDFRPTFDADGNQTLIKTSTGIWSVTYNAKNRPVLFVKSDNSVTVECTYDTMGRRATKKVTTNGTLTEHRRFLYRGYLQIACCDLTRAYTPALWFITWDPTQPTATRPLAIQKNGTWYTYGWDLTKNICETYRTDARIDLAYTYTPYGEASPAHAYDQPLRWSSEYHDTELGLVYYNYRHYNPAMGRWMGRDFADSSINTYAFLGCQPFNIDSLGNEMYVPQNASQSPLVLARKKNLIHESEEGSNKPRSYTFVIGYEAFKIFSKYESSHASHRQTTVLSIDALLDDIERNLKCNECISHLLIIAHGYYGNILRLDNNEKAFSDLNYLKQTARELSKKMCPSGKIVFFACGAAQSEFMLQEFSKNIEVKVMASTDNVSINHMTILKNGFSGTRRFYIPGEYYNSLLYSKEEGVFYSTKGEWRVFNPDGSQNAYSPSASDTAPIMHYNESTYIGLKTLFDF